MVKLKSFLLKCLGRYQEFVNQCEIYVLQMTCLTDNVITTIPPLFREIDHSINSSEIKLLLSPVLYLSITSDATCGTGSASPS